MAKWKFATMSCVTLIWLGLATQEAWGMMLQEEATLSSELAEPVQLLADGEPIDIGKLSSYGHAGPWLEDIDGDGDRDLLVGDFPGYFWHFDNEGSDEQPKYTAKGKLQAGDKDAKTPVY